MYKWEIEELKFQIGKLIQLHRLKRELSQLQLGNELNISSNHIGRIERAETNPTIESLVKICNFFEIDILYLFTKINEKELKKIEGEIEQLQKEFKNQNKRKSQ
ncbi:XRE family transcriptional regulator [Chryseobacterium piperi]|uniref:helix-turn-helix domain-containing protein n=1 Tax=Chryseobacterium piperi TaxID=558152 RepID=UPI00068AACE0|nr:helix-turn-helix transcriptional regulator [Chryseobacterium piperi]ASW73105.1 XRE family transcriptional regulator [Chryseobacterium piperi]